MNSNSLVQHQAEQWFQQNGYSVHKKEEFVTKTSYILSKGGHTERFDLPCYMENIKIYLDLFHLHFRISMGILALEQYTP